MTRPAELPEHERWHLDELLASCAPLTDLAEHVHTFAELLTTRRGADLEAWMSAVESSDLPALRAFVRGLCKDLDAVAAGLSLPFPSTAPAPSPLIGHWPAPLWTRTLGLPDQRRRRPCSFR